MINWMRIVNAALTFLSCFGVTAQLLQTVSESYRTQGFAYILGQVIAGVLLWIAPFYLAWRGLAPDSTLPQIRRASRANVAAAAVYALIAMGMTVGMSDKIQSVLSLGPFLLIMLIFEIPYALNMIALGKRKIELEEQATGQIPESIEAQALPDIPASCSTTVAAFPRPRQSCSNYFVRHWRGELSLGISYWLNGSLLATFAVIFLTMVLGQMQKDDYPLRVISFGGLGILLFSVIAELWSLVGIWRSANHHVVRGGSPGWAGAARVGVVIGTIATAAQLSTTILPQVKEFALIAIGHDPIGNINIKISANGQSAIIQGAFREGSAAEIEKILDAAPGVTSLMLNSPGGRLHEAKHLASVVRSRALNTYVEGQCASACTYVFLAGKDRAATPNAKIGFYRPNFPGVDSDGQQIMMRDMLDVYRAAKLPEAFIQRVAKTSAESMWYPTRSELIAAHVVTRVSLGGESASAGLAMRSKEEFLLDWGRSILIQSVEKRFPGITKEALERAWIAKENGGNDADIHNAMRSVIMKIYPELLKTADLSILESYVKLMISQLSAAQAISADACTRLLAGRLDITQSLPPNIVEQEKQLLLRTLTSFPTTVPQPPDPMQFYEVMQMASLNLPENYLAVVADTTAYASQPHLVCEATLAFFIAIDALPSKERHVALRGMFQGEN